MFSGLSLNSCANSGSFFIFPSIFSFSQELSPKTIIKIIKVIFFIMLFFKCVLTFFSYTQAGIFTTKLPTMN